MTDVRRCVALKAADLADAEEAVKTATARYRSGPYGQFDPQRQRTGRLGEHAFARWCLLEDIDRRAWFAHGLLHRHADLLLADGCQVEVKSWRRSTWERNGPAISAYQLPRIVGYHRIVFMVVDDGDTPARAEFAGWLHPRDISAIGQPVVDDTLHANARLDPALLRSVQTFTADNQPPIATPETWAQFSRRRCRCRAPKPLDLCWYCAPRPAAMPAAARVSELSRRRFFHVGDPHTITGFHPRAAVNMWPRVPVREIVATHRPCWQCLHAWTVSCDS